MKSGHLPTGDVSIEADEALYSKDMLNALRPPRNSGHHPEETVSARDHRPLYEVFGSVLPAPASRIQGSQLAIYCIINLILVGIHFQPYLRHAFVAKLLFGTTFLGNCLCCDISCSTCNASSLASFGSLGARQQEHKPAA